MLKYKINMEDALKRAKFNTYKAKTSGLLSQDTLKKYGYKPKGSKQPVLNTGYAAGGDTGF